MQKMILLLLLSGLSVAASAQTDSTYPTPEFSRQPYYYDKLNKQLVSLEKVVARLKNRMGVMGSGSSMVYAIDNPTSRVTVIAANRSEFIITDMMSGFMEPSAMMPLYKIKSGKKQREVAMTMVGGKKNDSDKIDYELKKSGEKYVFVVLQPLPPGEYAFVNLMTASQGQTITAYCFRVQ